MELPYSQEAEQSVIGSMLRDKNAVSTATEMLLKEDFFVKQYSLLFEAIKAIYEDSGNVDIITVQDKLRQTGHEDLADITVLRDIMTSVVTTANIADHCKIVKDKSTLRALITAGETIVKNGYSGQDSQKAIESTETCLIDLLERRTTKPIETMENLTMDVLHDIEEASKSDSPITGVPTGFIDLDYKTAGLQKSDLILIAARPSMGKTAFALNVVDYIGVCKDGTALIFSLEMSKKQLVARLLAMESKVDAEKLRKGDLSDEDWKKILDGANKLSDANIIIDDTSGISVSELRSKCRKIKLEKNISVIMIDYLQLMSGSNRESRQQEISEISRSLKALAREMDCPVVALSQLSRAVESRQDKRPMLSDLRESGAIEQDADIVMFIYRDDYYNKESTTPNQTEIIIAKQRNGPIGTVHLMWQPQYTKFVNMDGNPFVKEK